MKAQFNVSVREDLEGYPLQVYVKLAGKPVQELAVHLSHVDGWVDAKHLVEALRAIARVTEQELA